LHAIARQRRASGSLDTAFQDLLAMKSLGLNVIGLSDFHYWYHAHTRTKNTTGYPDLVWDKPYVKSDRYLGVAFKPGMGKAWVRFAVWDTAGNGAFVQPVWLNAMRMTTAERARRDR
jgi:hypothetical protein